MGTTQRISPGVPGQPNWGDLNKSVTNVAKTVSQEHIDGNDENTADQDAKDYKRIMDRRNNHIRAVYRNLIKTGGGAKNITSGRSSSIGRAGLKSSGRIAGFFSSVGSSGLAAALSDIGFGSLADKSLQDVIDYLLVYCSESNVGMDDTAANKASCEIWNELSVVAGNDLDKFEELLKGYVDGVGLPDLLCKFWGYYIFEHLSQRFEEKITQQKGEAISKETFQIIKDDIMGQVKVLNTSREVIKIDWKGAEGKAEIEKIFTSIINIIGDEDNN